MSEATKGADDDTQNDSFRARLRLAVAILAVVALVSSACRPVAPPGVHPWDPTGVLESVDGGRGSVTVTGWATQWDVHVGPIGGTRDRVRS